MAAPRASVAGSVQTEDSVRQGRAMLATTAAAYSYEGLDNEDLNKVLRTPFVPPSLPLAIEGSREEVFLGQRANVLCTDVNTLSSLGTGIGIYFRWLRLAFCFFVVCTVLSAPVFIMAVQGRRIAGSPQERTLDAFGFSLASVGNLGPSREEGTCTTANCTTVRTTSLWPGWDVPLTEASLIVACSDAAVTIALVLFLLVFARTISQVEDQIADNNLEAANFSVMVTGLPPSATKDEILEHFDNLYNLRKPDWTFKGYCCGCCMAKHPSEARPAFSKPKRSKATGELKAARDGEGVVVAPVLNAQNTGDARYLRRWVAEVVTAHPNGALVTRYRRMQTQLQRIRQARAAVKLYTRPSPFAHAGKLERAQRTLQQAQKKLEAVDARLSKQYSDATVAAFVVFNAEESRRRAVFDYGWSGNPCLRCCQPAPLRFRHRTKTGAVKATPIIVTPAPDPADILWENLEASACERCSRQALSSCAMLLVIAVSLVALVAARTSANSVEADAPSFAVCETSVVRHAAGVESPPAGAYEVYRDEARDTVCPDGSVSVYVANVTVNPPVPAPLVGGTDPEQCLSLCVRPGDAGTCASGTDVYKKRDLIGCHCMSLLTRAQEDGVLVTALAALSSEQLCLSLAASLANTNALRAAAAMTVVVVNVVLRVVSEMLSRFERHVSVGELQSAKVVKILLLTFVNTAVITALVNASIRGDNIPTWLSDIFGDVEGFEPRWFAVAGSSIVLTMALNVVSLNAGVLLRLPGMCCCFCCRPRTRRLGTIVPEQDDFGGDRFGAAAAAASAAGGRRGSSSARRRGLVTGSDDMVYNPSGMAIEEELLGHGGDASRRVRREYQEAVDEAKAIRVAQSSVTTCDRISATGCACCGPQELCGCIRVCCDSLPRLLQCWCCCRGARARAAVTQQELDELVQVGSFDVASRWPLSLNTVFVTLTYSAAMPLLYPVAALAFGVSYMSEKCALLRFTRQPPILDSSLARLSLRLLPIAIVLHLAVTVVTFNDAALLESRSVFDRLGGISASDTLGGWYTSAVDENSQDAVVSFAARLQREAVAIPLLLLVIVLLVWTVRLLLGRTFRSCLAHCLIVACCGRPCVDTRVVEEFRSNPPFTGLYAQPLARGIKHTLTEAEEAEGFRIERDRNVRGDRTAQRKIKVWTESGVTYGKVHTAGERMMTWETIADVSIASYDPTANPEYAEAFTAMEKAVDRAKKQLDLMKAMVHIRAQAAAARASNAHRRGYDDDGDDDDDRKESGGAAGRRDDADGLDEDTGIAWDVPDDESVASSFGSSSRHHSSRRAGSGEFWDGDEEEGDGEEDDGDSSGRRDPEETPPAAQGAEAWSRRQR